MKASNYTKVKNDLLNILSIASLLFFANTAVIAKETSSISGTDLGSSRIESKTIDSNKQSSFSGGALGSGRIKADKSKSKK